MGSIERKKLDGGKRCIVGGADGESCVNIQYTPGGSIHQFPRGEKEPSRYMHWVRSVLRLGLSGLRGVNRRSFVAYTLKSYASQLIVVLLRVLE